uniref:LYR motif-containing protein 2 n=1 Tax=Catharus ustulatus TaxID=91951 RepID=A0A8C3Y6W1_CATUS
MAAGRLPPGALTLKQFLRRQQVLQLYRKILRAIREVPAEQDRRYLKDWAREEFKRNKDATEEPQSIVKELEKINPFIYLVLTISETAVLCHTKSK